ncbi:MAG: anthranilate phosphoribosyltransferase, partial [Pseudomonadota bacterium]
ELKDGEVQTYQLSPADFGMTLADATRLKVDSAEASLAVIKSVLAGDAGPARDIVCLNAGAAIYVSGITDSLAAGVEAAAAAIDNGKAAEVLQNLVSKSNG